MPRPIVWRAMLIVCSLCGCRGDALSNATGISSAILSATTLDSTLQGDTVLAHPRLADAASITVIGNSLLATASHGAFVDVYRLSDRRLIGTLGRGLLTAGEAPSVWSIQAASTSDEAWIFDLGSRRLTLTSLAPGQISHAALDSVLLKSPSTLTGPLWISDSILVSPGFFDRGTLGVFDRAGTLLRIVGPDPDGDARVPATVRQHAYQTASCLNQRERRIALVARAADKLMVMDVSGAVVARVRGGFGFDPSYGSQVRHGRPIMVRPDSLRLAYVRVSCTEHAIYALFSGRSLAEVGYLASAGRLVHVFDWDGRLLAVLHLDSDVQSIAVDANDSEMYALTARPPAAVVRFRLQNDELRVSSRAR